MVQPAIRIRSAQEASDAARGLESPVEVELFEALASESPSVRAFLGSAEWWGIRRRIMGDGKPPTGRAKSAWDVARFLRWAADGAWSPENAPTPEARRAYLHAAREIDAYAQTEERAASPVSPAPPTRTGDDAWAGGFAQALAAVRGGRHITRQAWPAGAYVTAQAGYPNGIVVNENTQQATGLPAGEVAAFAPYLMMRVPAAPGSAGEMPPRFMPWTPGHDDLFADDWQVLPRPTASSSA